MAEQYTARYAENGHTEEVSIVPGVSILGVLSNLNYEPWFALAEYVDNAIQSAHVDADLIRAVEPDFRLKVGISYEREDGGRIVVLDNAGGIARSEFPRAFRAAEAPPDASGLSEFGMGMKSASIWFARNWRVVTTSVGDPHAYTVEFDMNRVLQDRLESLEVASRAVNSSDHYTRIELWNLNQFLPGRTLGKVRDHLREIYRSFLRDGSLELTVAGDPMHFREPVVLKAQDFRAGERNGISADVQTWRKEISISIDDGVLVSGWAAIRAEGRTTGNGLSLFRRGRLIVGTSDAPYRPFSIYGQGNSYRSQRLFGELSVDGLPVSHTKDGFQWHGLEESFERKLRALLDEEPLPLLKQAEGYRARKASPTEQKRVETATNNTAEVSERALPAALDVIFADDDPEPQAQATEQESPTPAAHEFTRAFDFVFDDRWWCMQITAAERPDEPRWLIRDDVDVAPGSGDVKVNLTLNTGHEFIRQFALGSTDALEAVFRLAVALVVSERLLAMDGEGAGGTFLRHIDRLLGAALSKRLKSDT